MSPTFELGAGWIEQYLSALVLLNAMLGHSAASVPLRKATPETIVRVLNELSHGVYRPEGHFQPGPPRAPFQMARPELVATERYTVIVMNARTAESDFASVETGGVVFEDPAWAVFAAESIGKGQLLGVPLSQDEAGLWKRLPLLEAAIHEGKYAAASFLGPVTGFTSPPVPSFHLLQVTGAELGALRREGLQSFGRPPKIYVLFEPPPASH